MKKNKKQELKIIRKNIDKIDEKLLVLLNQRADQAKKTTKHNNYKCTYPKTQKNK